MDTVPLIPRALLFGNPVFANPEVSPDGTRLFFLAPDEGVLNVWTAPIDDLEQAVPATHDRGRGIRAFGVCRDSRTMFYLRDADGDESWRLYLLDVETGVERCATPFDGVQARILGHYPWTPTTILLGLNLNRPHLHDLYRLDVDSGDLTKVAENPGYMSWVIDADLRPRGGTVMNPDGGFTLHLALASDQPQPWLEVPYEDAMGTRVVGFARDGQTLYLLSSIGANASRLFAVDVATGEHKLLAEDPVYDVKQVEMDPIRRTPQAVVFAKDRDEWLFLDEAFAKDIAQIRSELELLGVDGELKIDRSERTGRYWTVTAIAADSPVRFYLYDRADHDRTDHDRTDGYLRLLFSHQPELDHYRLARMEPFEFPARDGVTVHGYVTWPPGAEHHGLPAVVNVHGGPWARNWWGFDEEAQWLANRGYACVQVNYRSSIGYGKHFRNLGAKQWAAGMHTDLLDAIDHLAAAEGEGAGAIDPARVAVMGCSYGGYAALVGAAFTPERFTCAIDMCGPSNLLTLLAGGAPYRSPLQSFMHANVGDPETERAMLWDRSPLSRIDDIAIPILIAQGANDVRVPQAEAEQIVAALKAKSLPYEYLLFPDEGHGLAKPANRETFYAAVERFLAEHLA